METEYYREHSDALGHDVEFKRYGHAGKPVLFIPCQNGRFYDFENFNMTDIWGPYIESGEVMVFSIDTVDERTWSDFWGNARWRIEYYENWIRYITDELVPLIRATAAERNGEKSDQNIWVTGCSLGATHAANLYFRRPDLFDSLLALSGIYTAEYGFGTYMDDLVYNNSPVHFLANMPENHPYIEMYNERKAIICCGQGPWEYPDYTRQLQAILEQKGIAAWIDYWGFDCSHDWPWWYKQTEYFIPKLLYD